MSINTFWADFALEISNKLKQGSSLFDKEKSDMKKMLDAGGEEGV